MGDLKTYCLVRFARRSGKIDMSMEGIGNAMLRLWALQNTTKTKDTIIFEKDTGNICWYFEGTGDFPKVMDSEKEDLGNIEDYCEGLLAAVQEV
jgi:hypothetical protein